MCIYKYLEDGFHLFIHHVFFLHFVLIRLFKETLNGIHFPTFPHVHSYIPSNWRKTEIKKVFNIFLISVSVLLHKKLIKKTSILRSIFILKNVLSTAHKCDALNYFFVSNIQYKEHKQ